MGNVAFVTAKHGCELADRGLALAEGEQQPVTRRVAQGPELAGRGDRENFTGIVHGKSVNYS
jgi:hypothetical protein